MAAVLVIGRPMGVPAGAQDFPAKPITIVVSFGPGTANDIIARQLGQDMQATLGQSIVAENRAGATGNIAADYVAKEHRSDKGPVDGTSVAGTPGLFLLRYRRTA